MWKPGSAGYGFQANPTNTALAASLHRRCPCQHHRRLVPPGTGSDGALDAQSSSSIDYGASGARTSTNRGTLGAHTSGHCDAHPFTGRGSSAHRSPRHSSKGGRGGEEAVHGGALRMAAPAAAHPHRGRRRWFTGVGVTAPLLFFIWAAHGSWAGSDRQQADSAGPSPSRLGRMACHLLGPWPSQAFFFPLHSCTKAYIYTHTCYNYRVLHVYF